MFKNVHHIQGSYKNIWLGLQLKGGVYHRVSGGIIPFNQIPFVPGEPGQNGEIHLCGGASGLVGDLPSSIPLPSICDMMTS